MADYDKPPSYDNAGYAPPLTTPPQNPQFQASGVPPQQPYAGPPPNGAPYYLQQQQTGYNPGNVNVTVAGAYPSPPPTQYAYVQQPQVVVMNRPVQPTAVSMTGAIALSCVVYWLFGWVFGGIAYMLALSGQSAAVIGDVSGAIRMRNASYGVSIAGIVIFIIVIGIVVGVYVSRANTPHNYYSYCYYNYSYGRKVCY